MVDYSKLMTQATSLRYKLGEDAESPIDIFAIAQNIENLTIVFYPMSDNISGMCLKCNKSNVIAINSTMTLGRQRFTLAHEFYHLFYDATLKTVCSKSIDQGNIVEKEADIFASFFLAPSVALLNKVSELKDKHGSGKLNIYDIIRIEQFFGMSHQAVLVRLLQDKYLFQDEVDGFAGCFVRQTAELMGYDNKLYKPLPKDAQYKTYGHYIAKANEILEDNIISQGKYEELLLHAFRADLVYGDVEEGGEDVLD